MLGSFSSELSIDWLNVSCVMPNAPLKNRLDPSEKIPAAASARVYGPGVAGLLFGPRASLMHRTSIFSIASVASSGLRARSSLDRSSEQRSVVMAMQAHLVRVQEEHHSLGCVVVSGFMQVLKDAHLRTKGDAHSLAVCMSSRAMRDAARVHSGKTGASAAPSASASPGTRTHSESAMSTSSCHMA